ncbi:hypothetical protein DD630_30730 [Streptomyces sp. BSE7F]|nr:hypothetical protein DD630_30730 [Streptomyces sp. BSE7F]
MERAVDADLGPDGRFTDGALTSLDMLRSVRALETVLGTLPKTLLFDHPDCTALAGHLVERFGTAAVLRLADTAVATAPATDTDGSPRAPEPVPAPAPTGPAALVVPAPTWPTTPNCRASWRRWSNGTAWRPGSPE